MHRAKMVGTPFCCNARLDPTITTARLHEFKNSALNTETLGGIMPKPKVRKGMPSVQLTKKEFSKRARERFYDPTFTTVTAEIDRIIDGRIIRNTRVPARSGLAVASTILGQLKGSFLIVKSTTIRKRATRILASVRSNLHKILIRRRNIR